ARGVDEHARARGPGLDRRLDEDVQRALEVDDVAAVLEGLLGAPVGDAANEAVAVVGTREDEELTDSVEDAVRKQPCLKRPGPSKHDLLNPNQRAHGAQARYAEQRRLLARVTPR